MALINRGILWKSLKGIVCVYKPAEVSVRRLRDILIQKIVAELNHLDKEVKYPTVYSENQTLLEDTKSVDNSLSLTKQLDLSCHPSVSGPRYMEDALAVSWSNFLGWNTSGVLIFGLRSGTQTAKFIRENLPTRCYIINCMLGQTTNNGFAHGKVIEKSTWKHIKHFHMDRILSTIQASHQKKMFELCGINMQSQLAYDLAVKGTIRPANSKVPIIYGIKCVNFVGPEFTLEIQCVNEYETYLAELVREIGMKLHSTAHCVSVKCIRHSCFTLEHALLLKHWNLENIVTNMGICGELLNQNSHLLNQDSVALRQ